MKFRYYPIILLVIGLLVVVTSACTYPFASLIKTTNTAPPPTITLTPLPTNTRTPRPPTNTPLPPTVTPTASPSPTLTPLPQGSKSLPGNSPLISAQNLGQLSLYAQLPLGDDELILGELAFSPPGDRLAFATDLGELVVWDLVSRNVLYTFDTSEREEGVAYPDVAFSAPEGQYLASNGYAFLDEYGEYWSVVMQWGFPITETEGLEVAAVISPTLFTGASHWDKTGVTYTPDGQRLVVGSREGMGGGGSVKTWETTTGENALDISAMDWITDVAVSPDGGTLAGTSYALVILWDAESGDEKYTFSVGEDPLWGVSFSPNGRLLAAWGGPTIYLMDQFSHQVLYQLEGETDIVSAVFTPNGRILISADGATIRFWDVASYQLLSSLQMPEPVVALGMSPDGRTLAIGTTNGVVYLWGIIPD